jgi:prepilin-type N-terminal cleavage/methylation domain-containing protein
MPSATNLTRRAFTLVELLVVMTIIVIIASITAAVLPNVLRNGKVTQAANTIQGMLLAAKQRAARDRVPAGVRFILTTDTLNVPTGFASRLICTELAYVVQPDDLIITGDSLSFASVPSGPFVGDFQATSSVQDYAGTMGSTATQTAEEAAVQAGDYIECAGGLIGAIMGLGGTGSAQNILYTFSNPSNGFPVTSYRIIRMPRRVPGEDSMKLPQDVTVLVADVPNLASTNFANYTFYSLNIPSRVVPFNGVTTPPATYYYEIVFSPSGSVVGAGTNSGGQICIFVRDSSRDKITDGEPALVVVNPRTGAVSVQPVNPTASGYTYSSTSPPYGSGLTTQPVTPAASGYYTFATDTRASGM